MCTTCSLSSTPASHSWVEQQREWQAMGLKAAPVTRMLLLLLLLVLFLLLVLAVTRV